MKNKIIEWVIKIIGYAAILIVTSLLFKNTIYIDEKHFILYAVLATLIIYVLNMTIKPILFYLTLPITGITLGLFYPFINLFILKIVSLLLGDHFQIYGIFYAVIASLLISILNLILDNYLDNKSKEKSK